MLEPKKQDRQKQVCTINFIIYVEKISAIFFYLDFLRIR